MEYIYYKDAKGNFGDDLNAWLWPQFFGPHDPSSPHAFVGIGSILAHDSPLFRSLNGRRKIVFGTGVRPGYKSFSFDGDWDVRFLRGRCPPIISVTSTLISPTRRMRWGFRRTTSASHPPQKNIE